MASTPVRHRRKSSIVAFLNSTTKSIRKASKYDSGHSSGHTGGDRGGDINDNAANSHNTSGGNNNGIVESLKKKEEVAAAMCLSCSREEKIERAEKLEKAEKVDKVGTADKDAEFSCLFVSRIHKPDHSYNGGESGGLYNTYAFWKEGKERYLGVVRGAAEVYVVYVVVLPADPGQGQDGGGRASVEIRHKLPLRALRKVELEFLSSVHGFLADNNALCELIDQLEEDEQHDPQVSSGPGSHGGISAFGASVSPGAHTPSPSKKKAMNLFSDRQEEMDAEAVLNSLPWASTDLDGLKVMLQEKLEALEVDCCEQLIEWENEGVGAGGGGGGGGGGEEADERKESLGSLVSTLTELDAELEKMEEWLTERNLAIKPLTVDCREIENENNALEQTWRSYGSLAKEMDRLLNGLSIDGELENVLRDPLGTLGISDGRGKIQIDQIDSDAIDVTHRAGQALRAALDRAAEGGGVHLAAVNQRVETLLVISNTFCQSLGDALLNMFTELGEDMSQGLYVIEGGGHDSSKAGVALRIRNTQRRFQTLVMEFQPLIETLGSLKPEKVVGLRRGYADAVAKGVFNRKLVGEYFQRLRGVGEGEGLEPVGGEGWGGGFFGGGMGLKDYEVASLRGGGGAEGIGSDDNDSKMSSLGTSLEMALSDFVPMISREGYFVSSLFGLDESEGDNEAVRKRKIESVCGCIQAGAKVVEEGLNTLAGVGGVEVLSNLVGSLKIGETLSTMGKEGGDRYAVEVLTKIKDGADKVWEAWVEDQVAWIEEGHGIPYNGKRAGVFSSFARFPTFVDRVLSNVGKHGETSEAITGGIVKIAVALFSSLKSVVERDGTDKQYACHVVVLENCNFFMKAVGKRRDDGVGTCLDGLLQEAKRMFGKSCDKYLKWMIKREFKGLYTLFANISRIRKDVGDDDVLIHCPRASFSRTLGKEAGGVEVKEKVGEIRKRMEKHMCEESGGLDLVWGQLGRAFMKDYGNFSKVSGSIFNVKFEVGVVELGKLVGAAGGDERAVMRRRSGVERGSRGEGGSK
ncbi:hypothetical protein TrRE_jg12828 [Triparma retinervis]|uniref:Exocyst complex component Sec3 C-terminal domain-containing protein n=1 Tax=Triparma retinervis TaxID=2557542 RepID=A0A9W7KUE7_9STRA|nr:hypothetical protein TrRE_jg12828 [Triparma retinervis]